MKKQTLFGICGVLMTTLACTVSAITPITPTPVDQVGTIVAATMQALTATSDQGGSTPVSTQFSGTPISLQNVSFVIPNGLASGANPETMTAVDTNSGAPWEIAPTHLRFTLTGYQLQGKFFEPQIYVYPADEYAQANPGAAESIDRLQKILAGGALLKETLPNVPFFNAAPLLAANIQLIKFQGGSGVRELTQYDQYAAPVNNHELFYHFEGLTSDNRFYVIAILPITAPILAEDEKPESPVPTGGIPLPPNTGPNDVYYISVTQKLNALSPDNYTPSLNGLDALIQSIVVTNP
ncbi:MAG TPA: hypothetical protein VK206_19760 [Anaerolineales bacterium]|nr:hypothetical protein [Anaerolineales bacterium]